MQQFQSENIRQITGSWTHLEGIGVMTAAEAENRQRFAEQLLRRSTSLEEVIGRPDAMVGSQRARAVIQRFGG